MRGAERERLLASGRYVILHAGRECGEERWELRAAGEGFVLTGVQELIPPHPRPHRQEWRATLGASRRLTGLEARWVMGARVLRALHSVEGGRWHARIEYEGQVREQEGEFPEVCEVDYGTPVASVSVVARREFRLGTEHEFPVLRIGPSRMAVMPERMRYRLVEEAVRDAPNGPVRARRFVVSLPSRPEAESRTLWTDEDGTVLESYEGPDTSRSWMRLVEYRRGREEEAPWAF